MSFKIKNFDTISRHQSKLTQSPAVITSLVDVLKYVREVLDDDQTTTLFQMIEHHLNTKDLTAHHLNIKLLSGAIMGHISDSFVANGRYDGGEDGFIPWLLSNPQIYHFEEEDGLVLPDDYDAFGVALTLGVVLTWFATNHDQLIMMHGGTLATYLDKLLATAAIPVYVETPDTSFWAPFAIMGNQTYATLTDLVIAKLNANPPSQPVIDFWSNVDSADFITQQPVPDDEYLAHLEEYGESDSLYFRRKYLNYYTDHLMFVLSDGMEQALRDYLTDLRGTVNSSYTKAYYVNTILNRYRGYSINIEGVIDKFTQYKTLDLFNLTGLRKSIAALSLVPYEEGGVIYNRLDVSFDNYNPAFTSTLVSGIEAGQVIRFRFATCLSQQSLEAYVAIGDHYQFVRFENVNRMYDVDPHFLFVPPRIGHWEPGAIRVNSLRLFGQALTEEGADTIIAGFRQR